MDYLEEIDDRRFLFGSLFVVANKLDTLLDRDLSQFNMTSKQWLLACVIDNLFEAPPTIKEVAKEIGNSHQNVKQIALKLKEKGFLHMEKDPKDARVTRVSLTDESSRFWQGTQMHGAKFMFDVFDHITDEELAVTRRTIEKLSDNLDQMEKEREQ
ncbi:MAG: MarR family transcriptional regulator [Clostridiales bacterium 43-6]|nr:MAG: MarR family transcriptional regulator [Clostridiales bacterium 43-6]